MKKTFISALTICAIALCLVFFGACGESGLSKLDSMAQQDYSQTNLTYTTYFEDSTSLVAEFKISFDGTKYTVVYSVEQFASIDLDQSSTDQKQTVSGTAVVQNGAKVSDSGSADFVDFVALVSQKLHFDEAYFQGAVLGESSFFAKVTDAAGFFGTENFEGTDITVSANFGEVLKRAEVSYTLQSGTKVKVLWQFEK